jgi:hypothetical protein
LQITAADAAPAVRVKAVAATRTDLLIVFMFRSNASRPMAVASKSGKNVITEFARKMNASPLE